MSVSVFVLRIVVGDPLSIISAVHSNDGGQEWIFKKSYGIHLAFFTCKMNCNEGSN